MANMERIPWQMWMRIIHSGWAAVVKLECNVEIKTVHSLPHGMSMRGRDLDSRRLRICLIMDKRETSTNSGSAAGRNGEYRNEQIFPQTSCRQNSERRCRRYFNVNGASTRHQAAGTSG
ncbi:hypothetical protein [Pontibaca methylaminivorans]|uniref:hypothetical protein n=1 Tax=Pontibaca methylaminivorans TaxID=515897 RepID=UPI002FDA3AE9